MRPCRGCGVGSGGSWRPAPAGTTRVCANCSAVFGYYSDRLVWMHAIGEPTAPALAGGA